MIHNCCAFGTADLQQSPPLGSAAGAAAGVEAGAETGAETGEVAGRENRLAKQHVAPKDKRGRWAGINSTTEGRETRSPEILSPCGAAALNERGSDDPLLSG